MTELVSYGMEEETLFGSSLAPTGGSSQGQQALQKQNFAGKQDE